MAKYVYFEIPKCATQTIVHTINGVTHQREKEVFRDDNNAVIGDSSGFFWNGKTRPYFYTDIKRANIDDWFKFTFIRNPYERYMSLYAYCKRERWIPEELSHDDFLELINNVLKDKSKHTFEIDRIRNHAVPMYLFVCEDEKIKMDFIGKFENLEKDIKYVCEKLDKPTPKRILHYNRSSTKNYKTYYSEELAKKVYDFYEKDFLIFGYNKNSWK